MLGGLLASGIGAVGSLFGGRQAMKQADQGFNYLRDSLGGTVQTGTGANQLLGGLLGVGGDPAMARQGFQTFLDSTGFQSELGAGIDALNSNAAARGMLESGDTLRGTQQLGQDLAQSRFQNYLANLSGLSGQGVSAAGAVGGAASSAGAQKANITQDTSNNFLSGIGSLFGGLG